MGPVRHLVAAETGGLQLRACCVELVPLKVGFDLGHPALRAPAVKECALLERKAVGGNVVWAEGDRSTQRFEPCLQALERNGVDEVDAHVRHPHLARETESTDRLRSIGLAFEHRQSPLVKPLHAEAQPVDTALQPGRDLRLVGACWIRLQGDLSVRRDVEVAANELEQPRHLRGGKQARRPPSEVDRLELLKRISLAGEDELLLEGVDIFRHEAVHPGIRVEVAVTALVPAKRDMDV